MSVPRPSSSSAQTANGNLNTSISRLTSAQLRQRDVFGATLLHHLVRTDRFESMRALLKNSRTSIELNLLDYENGWNCLHWAVFKQNFVMADLIVQFASQPGNGVANRLDTLLKQKDREGYTPLDLLGSGLDPASFQHAPESVGSVARGAAWTKKNRIREINTSAVRPQARHDQDVCRELVLLSSEVLQNLDVPVAHGGVHHEQQDRASVMESLAATEIRSVHVSSRHTVVVTVAGTLAAMGHNSKGRLGLRPSKAANVPALTAVPAAAGSGHVTACCCSADFTVFATDAGEVYGFGTSEFGCLGSSSFADTARWIAGIGDVSGGVQLACSAIHVAAYTETEIWLWGLNVGQLGFATAESGDAAVHGNDAGRIQRQAQALQFRYGKIKAVQCTERATVVITEKDEIHLYARGWHARFQPPMYNRTLDELLYVFKPKRYTARITVTKLIARGEHVVLLYDNGNVVEFSTAAVAASATAADFTRTLKFQTLWNASKPHLACRDVDIAQDGSIVICTGDGAVYRRERRQQAKKKTIFKFSRVPQLNNVVKVHSDPEFKRFVFMKKAVNPLPLRLPRATFHTNIARSFSVLGYAAAVTDAAAATASRDPESRDEAYVVTCRWVGCRDAGACFARPPAPVSGTVLDSVANCIDEFSAAARGVVFKIHTDDGHVIPVFHAVLAMRSRPAAELFRGSSSELRSLKNSEHRLVMDRAAGTVRARGFGHVAVCGVLHYAYTGKAVRTVSAPQRAQMDELMAMLAIQIVGNDYTALVDGPEFADAVVELADGQRVQCYSPVLRAGSEFCDKLFAWHDENGHVPGAVYTVDFRHIRADVFAVVLAFLHGADPFRLFEPHNGTPPHASDAAELVNFVLSCIEVADEMLLHELKDYLQFYVCEFLDLSNVLVLLRHASALHCQKLLENCLWLVYNNMSFLLFDAEFHALVNDGDHGLLAQLSAGFEFFGGLRRHQKRRDTVARGSEAMLKLFIGDPAAFDAVYLERGTFEPTFEVLRSGAAAGAAAGAAPVAAVADAATATAPAAPVSKPSSDLESNANSTDEDESAVAAGDADSSTDGSTDGAGQFIEVISRRRRSSAARKVSMTAPKPRAASLVAVQPSAQAKMRANSIDAAKAATPVSFFAESPSPAASVAEASSGAGPSQKPAKLKMNTKKPSQRERRKLAEEQQVVAKMPVPSPSPRGSTPVWGASVAGAGAGAGAAVSGTPSAVPAAAVARKGSTDSVSGVAMRPAPSLSEIMFEQESRAANRNRYVKPEKTLAEIQAEEEFERWFEQESEKYQKQQQQQQQQQEAVVKKGNRRFSSGGSGSSGSGGSGPGNRQRSKATKKPNGGGTKKN